MYKTSKIIVLCCFAIFNMTKVVENTIISADDATDEHVKLLSPIGPKEALPIVLFATSQATNLTSPVGLSKVNINEKGRLASGTAFYTKPSAPQIFFCPDTSPRQTENCLIPTQFEESADLQCEIEPRLALRLHTTEKVCGPTKTGIGLHFGYKICPAQRPNYSYHTDRMNLYSICYHQPSKKIIFVGTEIIGAGMVSDKLLTREREVKFDMNTETFGFIAADYEAILKAKIESKPQYDLQQLVPSDDMALANWRKSTQYIANFDLQHNDLIGPWNHVRSLLRTHAEKSLDRVFDTITGVFDIPKDQIPASVDENQIANFWVTFIFDFSSANGPSLAVIMNNFVAGNSNKKNSVETSEQQYIDKICGEDSCVDSLKEKFRNVGGQIRCCQINQSIWSLIMPSTESLPSRNQLRITGINN